MPVTWLYAPAHSHHAPKALSSTADVVILDLEDAVPAELKPDARREAHRMLQEHQARPVEVRINPIGTPWHHDDLNMLAQLPRTVGVRVPKVGCAAEVEQIRDVVKDHPISALIETAEGVMRAGAIATAVQPDGTVALGEADLSSQLGATSEEALGWARGAIVMAAAAAGLDPPSMSIYANINDLDGLHASCLEGRRIGMHGRSAIHPRQLPTIRDAFTPTPEEVAHARATLEHLGGTGGTAVLDDGSFVDPAMIRNAQRTLALTHTKDPHR